MTTIYKLITCTLLCTFLFGCNILQKQQSGRYITGYVTDTEGLPLMNICVESIYKSKTQILGHTGHNGKFSLCVPDRDSIYLTFHSKYNKLPYSSLEDIDDYQAKVFPVGRDSLIMVSLQKTPKRIQWDSLIDKEMAKARYIEGYVQDEGGRALTPLIWVENLPFVPRGTEFFTYCNEEGYFCIAVPDEESVSITFRMAGCADKTIVVQKGSPDMVKVILERVAGSEI
ncbi:hypothetical protein D0T84_08805 [Dysgonomonas sp. 521]|uniref:hypothetical protein n=1 Tax=Dysgonomonas sp. 521 TaxID=2302932 RepID=UPI0013D095BC|nr:hypothetical protein [Dysgonomonas sp. 521]NDV95015.1 hypothetical protein [Dysgonomonas sp. 521]